MNFLVHHLDLVIFIVICVTVPVVAGRYWVKYVLGRRRGENSGRAWVRWLWTILLIVELGCVPYGFVVEPRWLDVSYHEHVLPGLGGSLRVVHLSDLHLEGDTGWHHDVISAVEAAKPDLVFLTGDYLNDHSRTPELRAFLVRLVRLAGRHRVFAVTGNFEMAGGPVEVFADADVPLLDGVVVTVTLGGTALQVAGIGSNPLQVSEELLRDIADQLEPSVPSVLLYHMPGLAESSGIEAFDFVFCGHTHGGQVRLPFYGALITMARFGKRYEAGLYRLNPKTRLYVNRGIGNEPAPAPQVRFLCRPEVAVFDFSTGS